MATSKESLIFSAYTPNSRDAKKVEPSSVRLIHYWVWFRPPRKLVRACIWGRFELSWLVFQKSWFSSLNIFFFLLKIVSLPTKYESPHKQMTKRWAFEPTWLSQQVACTNFSLLDNMNRASSAHLWG